MEKKRLLEYKAFETMLGSLLYLVVGLIFMIAAQLSQSTAILGLGIWFLMISVIILKNFDFTRNRLLLIEINDKLEPKKR